MCGPAPQWMHSPPTEAVADVPLLHVAAGTLQELDGVEQQLAAAQAHAAELGQKLAAAQAHGAGLEQQLAAAQALLHAAELTATGQLRTRAADDQGT